MTGTFGRHSTGIDVEAVVTSASREIFAEEPCTLAAASVRLGDSLAGRDARSLGQVARTGCRSPVRLTASGAKPVTPC